MADTIHRTVVQLDADQNKAKRLEQRIAAVRKEFKTLAHDVIAADAQFRALGQRVDRSTTSFSRQRREVKALTNDLSRATREARSLGQATIAGRATASSATARQRQESIGRSAEGISSIGMAASLLGPNISGATGDIALMFRAAKGVQVLGQEMPKLVDGAAKAVGGVGNLAAGAGIAAAATVGLYLAMDMLGKSAEKSRERVLAEIEFEKRRSEIAPEQQNTEKLQEEADALDKAIAARDEEIKRLEEDRAALFDSYNAVEQLGEALGVHNQGLDDYDERLKTLNVDQQADIKLRDELIATLGKSSTAINDEKDALEAATAARVEQYSKETQFIIASQRMSADQIKDRQAQIRTEQQWYGALQRDLTRLAPTSEEAAAQLEVVNQKMADLTLEAGVLASVLPQADLKQLQQDASEWLTGTFTDFLGGGAKKVTESVQGVSDAFQDASIRADDYRAKLAEVNDDRNRQLVREEEDAALARVRAIADHYRELADLDAQYYEERQQIAERLSEIDAEANTERDDETRDYHKAAARAARDHARRILDIQKDANLSIQDAASRLDAAGVWSAQQQAARDLEQEKDQYEDEKQARDEDYKDRLAQIKRNQDADKRAAEKEFRDLEDKHRRERAAHIAAFNREIQRDDEDRRIKAQRQQEDWAIQDQRLAAHYGVIAGKTSTHYTDLQGRTTTGMANVAAAFSTGLSALVTQVQNAFRVSIPRHSNISGSMSGGPTAFASGGYPPVGRDVWVGERGPELVRFMQPARVFSANHSRQSKSVHINRVDIQVSGVQDVAEFADRVRAELAAIIA